MQITTISVGPSDILISSGKWDCANVKECQLYKKTAAGVSLRQSYCELRAQLVTLVSSNECTRFAEH
jgi:hypothetical protein